MIMFRVISVIITILQYCNALFCSMTWIVGSECLTGVGKTFSYAWKNFCSSENLCMYAMNCFSSTFHQLLIHHACTWHLAGITIVFLLKSCGWKKVNLRKYKCWHLVWNRWSELCIDFLSWFPKTIETFTVCHIFTKAIRDCCSLSISTGFMLFMPSECCGFCLLTSACFIFSNLKLIVR